MNKGSLDALSFKPQMVSLGQNYLLLGTDAWQSDYVLRIIQSELKQQQDIETINLYGDDIQRTELGEVLDTYSIFASSKLIVIRNAEMLKAADQQALTAYFKDTSEIQSLVLHASKIDKRLSVWKAVRQSSLEIVCDPPRSHYDLQKWLDFVLKQKGKQMDASARSAFLARVELDYAIAYNELEKLLLMSKDRYSVGAKDVERSLGTSRVGTMIDFYRALGRRDLPECLKTINRMLDSDWEGLQVFFQFNKFYNSIHNILALKANKISDTEIANKHLGDLFPTQRQEFIQFSKSYTLKQMRCIIRILLETDSQFKLSMSTPHTLLELCAIRIMDCK